MTVISSLCLGRGVSLGWAKWCQHRDSFSPHWEGEKRSC